MGDQSRPTTGQMRRDATGMRILLGVLVSASCFQVHAAADVAHKPDTSRNQLLDFGGRRTLQCVGEDGSCSSSGGCCAGLYCRASASKCTSGLGRGPLRGEECISGICAFGMLCMEGLCRAPGDLGTPCETSLGCNAGYYCAARNLVCEALGGVDDPCDSSSPCGDGLKCSTGSKPLCVVWPTIRLAGRPGITKGRVEVYMNDTWGTVCDKNFDEVDAGVVCKQLGFSSQGAQAYGKSYFGKGIGPIHMVGVSCTGSEASLQECGFKPTNKCLHRADAAVVCKMENIAIGTVELMGAEDMSKDGYAAIDGNTNGSWSGGSIAHSRKTGWTSPYLSLDKDVGQWKIEKIVLFNCVDACCSDRLFPFTLTLYNTHGQISGKVLEGQISEKVLEETIDKSDVKNKKNKINFFLSDQNFVANQVRITLPGEDRILNIAELEVYGYKYDPPPNPPPVATHCPSPSTSLFEASKSGNALCVGALFDAGADINMADEYDQTPLHFAAEFGDVDTVIALLVQGANPEATDADGWTPLHGAAKYKALRGLTALLDFGANYSATDKSGFTPLLLAAGAGNVDCIMALLDKGSNISTATNTGQTPLHLAAEWGAVDAMLVLLDRGAEISATSMDGRTALHYASSNRFVDATMALLDRGADISATTNEGWTALHFASQYGLVEKMIALLDRGANMSATTNDGWTALHFASNFTQVGAVIALLDRGADMSTIDMKGETAYDLASTDDVRSAFHSRTPPPASPRTPPLTELPKPSCYACVNITVFYNSHPKQPKLPSGSCLAVNEFLNNNAIITAPATFPGSTCTSPPHEATVGGRDASLMATCAEVDTVKGAQWMDDVFNEFIYMPILANKVSESGINVQVIASVSEECGLDYEPNMYQLVV